MLAVIGDQRESMQVLWFVVVLCCVVGGCARVARHQGSTLSDFSLATGFSPFNLPTCGQLPKGRDHSNVESGKHTCMSALFIVVVVCLLFCLLSFCAYRFSRIMLWLQIFTVPVHVRGKMWGVCILGFTGNGSH